jgi:hypothetical protein
VKLFPVNVLIKGGTNHRRIAACRIFPNLFTAISCVRNTLSTDYSQVVNRASATGGIRSGLALTILLQNETAAACAILIAAAANLLYMTPKFPEIGGLKPTARD